MGLHMWTQQVQIIAWEDIGLKAEIIESVLNPTECYQSPKHELACQQTLDKYRIEKALHSPLKSSQIAELINFYYARAYDPHTYILPVNAYEFKFENIKSVSTQWNQKALTVKINKLNTGACVEVYQVLQGKDLESLILDLQDNPGGSINEAICLLSLFINNSKEPLFKIAFFDPKRGIQPYYNQGRPIYNGALKVLINGRTGSSAELTASVLQFYKRANVAGRISYGKATVQEMAIWDHNTNVLLFKTVGKMLLPTGQSHYMVGVTPDEIIPETTAASHSEVNTVMEAL